MGLAAFNRQRRLAAEQAKAEAAAERAEPKPIDDLETLTVGQLRNIAESGGIDLTGITRKADIITAIEAVGK